MPRQPAPRQPAPRQPLPVQAEVRVNRLAFLPILLMIAVPAGISVYMAIKVSGSVASDENSSRAAGPNSQIRDGSNPDVLLGKKLAALIPCISDHPYDSRERYLQWVDPEKGPTGKERNISYSLYAVRFHENCVAAVSRVPSMPPSLPALDTAVASYAASMQSLVPLVESARSYYGDEDYKDDDAQKGRELHPKLMTAFASFAESYESLANKVTGQADALLLRELAHSDKSLDMGTYWAQKSFIAMHNMVRISNAMNPKKIKSLDLSSFSEQLDQSLGALKKLSHNDKENKYKSYASSVKGLLKAAKGLRRQARIGKEFKKRDRERMGTSAGWMTDNSPDRIRKDFGDALRHQSDIFGGSRVIAISTDVGAKLDAKAFRSTAASAPAARVAKTNRSGAQGSQASKASKVPAPTGPVLTTDKAEPLLKPLVLACMRESGVYALLTRFGNKSVGPVHVLQNNGSNWVDGRRTKLKSNKLAKCLNAAGKTLRVRAFRSDYIYLNLKNTGVANPLAGLPAKANYNDVMATIDSVTPKIKACARKHGEEAAKESFTFVIDGPSGKVHRVGGAYRSKAFRKCATAIYRGLNFTKVQKIEHKATKNIQL